MAAESIITYKKLTHPEYRVTDKSVRTDIEYVGPYSTLSAPLFTTMKRGLAWGDYPGLITDISIRSIEGTNPAQAELTVSVEYETSATGGDFGIDPGIDSGTVYEIDWTVVMRPLVEHPEFAVLDDTDRKAIAKWDLSKSDEDYEALPTLAAKYYARGIMWGIENYQDFAPVLIKTTSYTNGPGSTSDAGEKDDPGTFPNKPSGYEWVKIADRSLRSGTRDKWDRTEQWMGSKKVLVDKNSLFYES